MNFNYFTINKALKQESLLNVMIEQIKKMTKFQMTTFSIVNKSHFDQIINCNNKLAC
jgi:hypothetical protein